MLGKSLLLSFVLVTSPIARAQSYCADILALPLPVVAQTTYYTCGAACLDSVLKHWRGTSPGEWALAVYLRTSPWSGTLVTDIVSVATQYGLHARMQNFTTVDDLRGFLQRGETVYLSWIAEGTPHFSLLRGLGRNHITLMDPWHAREHPGEYRSMSLLDFIPNWFNGSQTFGAIIRISAFSLQ